MNDICWVETVSDEDAVGDVRAMFDAVQYNGGVENLYRAGSLFPKPVAIADQLYKAVMHDPKSPLELWACELAATYVAILSDCPYAQAHHGANFCQLYGNRDRAQELLGALRKNLPVGKLCDSQTLALLNYTHRLTLQPEAMRQGDIQKLRDSGWHDSQIVHLNQVVASFAYWIRIINGLGIELADGPIGLYPQQT